jgi:hypothetical protein
VYLGGGRHLHTSAGGPPLPCNDKARDRDIGRRNAQDAHGEQRLGKIEEGSESFSGVGGMLQI